MSAELLSLFEAMLADRDVVCAYFRKNKRQDELVAVVTGIRRTHGGAVVVRVQSGEVMSKFDTKADAIRFLDSAV